MNITNVQIQNVLKNKTVLFWGMLSLLLMVFAGIKSYNEGMDANVYLYASKQLFSGDNIYTDNPYNFYLYSPFFAFMLWPFSVLGEAGRALWGVFNMVLFLRLAYLFSQTVLSSLQLEKSTTRRWYFGAIILSFGMVLHNVSLGQITILILWLTFEGLHQVLVKEKKILGGILLGLGVIIKIIPGLALFYLALKKQFKAGIAAGITVGVCLILPALFIGLDQNTELLTNWEETINPSRDKYVFEFDNGTYSLNAVLPAYFYDFEGNNVTPPTTRTRQLLVLSDRGLMIFLQTLRVALALGLIFFVYYTSKREKHTLYFIWEFAYLCLVTALIFPHQQKYAMLYFVPAGTYFLLFFLVGLKNNWKGTLSAKILGIAVVLLMLLFSAQGRDIIGNPATEFLDDYHTFGLINLLSVGLLLAIRPDQILQLSKQ
jgi:hypothetical protein